MLIKQIAIRLLISIALLTFMCFGVYMCFIGFPKNRTSIQEIHIMVNREITIGWSPSQVNAWLDSKKISHSFISGEQNLKYSSVVESNGFTPNQLLGYIAGIIPDTSREFLTTGAIHLTFFFDKKGKLIKYSVEEIGTGP